MSTVIKSHNKTMISKYIKELKPYNCKVIYECPLNIHCQVTDTINKSTVLSPGKLNKVCFGTAECDFKKRFYNYRKSCNKEVSTNDTTLSKYIWELKETSNLSSAIYCSLPKGSTLS